MGLTVEVSIAVLEISIAVRKIPFTVVEVPFAIRELSIAVVETSPTTTAFITVILAAVEGSRLRMRKLMLRRRVEVTVVGGWVREVWFNPWGVLITDWSTVGGFAQEPGGVVGALHGV